MAIYEVHARVEIVVATQVTADNLLEAAEKASKLALNDFLPEKFVVEDDNNFTIEALFS